MHVDIIMLIVFSFIGMAANWTNWILYDWKQRELYYLSGFMHLIVLIYIMILILFK